jgi:enediyne polyketide synthase
MTGPLAIVGLACRYPDARSPEELWELVVAQRRAFRRMPDVRLRLEDYYSPDPAAPDRTYAQEAAILEGYSFDRVRYRVAGSTFRSADMAHWLALDVATEALKDAGFEDGRDLPRETTGVVLGNTLTGEFSRAGVMRYRWPYVRRVVESELAGLGLAGDALAAALARLEERYKEPFPPVGEESLAGGLANTIAGRICNHHDLKGGGYTVDGACASSLLAVTHACAALAAGDLDVVLVGGVDLSLDPFELVGFAKTGALAPAEMRVFDQRSAGFWPGEGCGVAVMMRQEDALARGLRIRALVRGWGVSSDGQGGITRPEVEGQRLALRRAYRRAGFGIDTVGYFEGHGTGTAVGDATEIEALSRSLREAGAREPIAALGSVKANIGHTKAAAGMAGLTKAVLALEAQTIPPACGVDQPHPLLRGEGAVLRVTREPECWPSDRPLRAAVSGMGFGGINSHVVLEAAPAERRRALAPRERRLAASAQDGELFLLSAAGVGELGRQVEKLGAVAAALSRAELTDLACELQRSLVSGPVRAAVVAATPRDLAAHLQTLAGWLAEGATSRLDAGRGVFLGTTAGNAPPPRLGFLFPGQGSPSPVDGGLWRRRFDRVKALYDAAALPRTPSIQTDVAQPAIVTASLAGLRVLADAGLRATVALGHSLGELVALHWAGAMDEGQLLRLSRVRGQGMASLGAPSGAMASVALGPGETEALLAGTAVIAGYNSPRQTVVSGDAASVEAVIARARQQGASAIRLPVSHAFHSPLVEGAARPLADHLAGEPLAPLAAKVISTVTGSALPAGEDLRALLCRQITAPVRFTQALAAAGEVDLWVEVGPGRVLSGLVAESGSTPVIPLDAGGASVLGLLQAVGAAFALGAPVERAALFDGRFARPFDLQRRPSFLENPCERAPLPASPAAPAAPPRKKEPVPAESAPTVEAAGGEAAREVVRQLVAARAELPAETIREEDHLLADLHLNSISVSQVVVEAARRLGLSPPAAPLDYSQARVGSLVQAMEELVKTGGAATPAPSVPAGVDAWTRAFEVEWVEQSRPATRAAGAGGEWQIFAAEGHPFAAGLRDRLQAASGGPGVAVCLPARLEEAHAALLLRAARAVLALPGAPRFLVVQHGGGGGAFARTLHIEAPRVATCIVDVPERAAGAVEWIAAEAAACASGLVECRYDAAGVRRVPALRLLPDAGPAQLPLGAGDVLLATGGGKGISAECALDLARATGAKVALLGRSRPQDDAELAANLARFTSAGLRMRYVPADVTDAAAVRRAVGEIEAELGPVTAVLHGAGANVPRRLESLDEATLLRTLAPKYAGAQNVLAAVSPDRLRLFVAFGSIIGRMGMVGEADYALANEWLTRRVAQLREECPRCRCVSVEWSIWSGVGMGERLGRVDALASQGISAIPPDQGIAILRELVARPELPAAVVVSGRLGERPPLEAGAPELPFLRFLERPRVHYPGIELVVDAELSGETDLGLDDHVYRGERLLPAVMGLEAMAQAVMGLTGAQSPPAFERVVFERPIVIPQRTRETIRIAALVRGPGTVEVVLRCAQTSFQVDHFRAACRPAAPDESAAAWEWTMPPESASHDGLVPARDLYGGLFFHRGRFRRIARYHRLKATECVAELAPSAGEGWFARYLPDRLVLGDPAARDAAIHGIQVCIPHLRLLPAGVDRMESWNAGRVEPRFVVARERHRSERLFIYDVEIVGARGERLERWLGLKLMAVEPIPAPAEWPPSLLAASIERRVADLIPGTSVEVAMEQGAGVDRRARSDRAFRRLLKGGEVKRRPDGKPVAADRGVSAAHSGTLTLAVAGPGEVACDLQTVEVRPLSVWRELLGRERADLAELVAREQGEDLQIAGTRVWTAVECVKKAGLPAETPLLFRSAGPEGWMVFSAGQRSIATVRVGVQEAGGPLVAAVLPGAADARV